MIPTLLPRRSRQLLPALALALLVLLGPGLAAAARAPLTPVRVSTDPYTNGSSMHQTEVEPDTFAYGATIVAAFQVGRFSDGGASNIGWATSTNSGATWTNGFLPGITVYAQPPGTYQRISDPAVAYDARHGTWLILALPLPGGGVGTALTVSRSTDGGLTWQLPVFVTIGNGFDKTWIACDNTLTSPYYGHCYAQWDNNFAGNLMQMSTSSDGGLTWGAPQTPAGGPSGLAGQPLVQPNGTVIVPYSANYGSIGAFRSTDGGASWGSSVFVDTSAYHSVAGNLRAYPMPSAELDPTGRLFIAWMDCRFRAGCASNDIVFSSSTDGVTWAPATRVPIDPVSSTVDHFLPGLGVDPTWATPHPHLALTYYYYPVANCSACALTVGYVSSSDGGATWTPPVPVAGPMTQTWLPLTNQGYMVGDYLSTSFAADGKAHPVFAVATVPGSTFDEAMYTPVPGLVLGTLFPRLVQARTVPAGGDRPVYVAPTRPPLKLLPTAH